MRISHRRLQRSSLIKFQREVQSMRGQLHQSPAEVMTIIVMTRCLHVPHRQRYPTTTTPFPFVRHDAEFTACIEQQFSFQALKPAYTARQHCAHHHRTEHRHASWSSLSQCSRNSYRNSCTTTQRAESITAERSIAFQFEVSDQAGAA